MHSERLEKGLQKLSDALSEFDDALVDVQMNSVPGPTESDIRRRRLIIEIDSDLSDVSEGVCGIGEKFGNINRDCADRNRRT